MRSFAEPQDTARRCLAVLFQSLQFGRGATDRATEAALVSDDRHRFARTRNSRPPQSGAAQLRALGLKPRNLGRSRRGELVQLAVAMLMVFNAAIFS